jgi:glycosyltransferase involved in cell wall biosynthesis
VVTVSEFTKSELIKYIGFLPEQIRVIPNAVDHNLFKIRSNSELELFKEKYRLPKSYLLTVGIGKEHKNTDFLVRNLIMLNKKGENLPPLVLGGAGGSIPDYIINSLPSAKEVVIPFPKIPFEELPLLYAGAKLFIFPSLYEGFGFPPLEASACGCPVLASSVASIPEVMHDAAFYFDPTSDEDFQIKFLDLIKNSELLKSKIETGFQNTKKFSWENSAKQMIECWET